MLKIFFQYNLLYRPVLVILKKKWTNIHGQVKEHIENCVILCKICLTLHLNKNIKKYQNVKLN